MKQSLQITSLIIMAFLFIIPSAAFSEVKISLRNGREIIAETCRDTKDRLICEKMGGTFEIEQKDILDVRWIAIERQPPAQEEAPAGEGTQTAAPAAEETQNTQKPEGGVIVRGAGPEQEKRLDQIYQRKRELKAEREKLGSERERLQEEIKKADAYLSPEKFDELQKKAGDLDARIQKFSSELKALNEEEAALRRVPQTP